MYLLDTCIWLRWVNKPKALLPDHRRAIEEGSANGIGLSIYSCWEVAKKVSKGSLILSEPVGDRIATASTWPGIVLLPLTTEIVVDSCNLPGILETNDPADHLIIATARSHDLTILRTDTKILPYPHMRSIG